MRTLLLTERELHRVISILVENKRLDYLREKFPNVTKEDFDAAVSIDPTANNKYTQWLLTQEAWKVSDFYKDNIKKFLKEFDKEGVRNKLEEKDINKYKINDFYNVMTKLDVDIKADRFTSKPEILNKTKIGETENYVVYKPTTYWHSCKIGTNTKWCTSSTTSGRGHFKTYTQDGGELLIFVNKNDETQKYQFATKRKEFKNENNSSVKKPDEIRKFIGEYLNIDLKELEHIENDLLREFIEIHNGGDYEIDDYELTYEGNDYIDVTIDGEEWQVWADWDSLSYSAVDRIENNLQDGLYGNDFLQNYMEIDDYYIKDMAQWDANSAIEDYDADDLVGYLGTEEEEMYDKIKAIEDADYDEEVGAIIEKRYGGDESEYLEATFGYSSSEDFIDSLRNENSSLWDNLYQTRYDEINDDPIDYYVRELGYDVNTLVERGIANVNYREAAEDLVDEEWVYVMAHYDNDYITLPSDAYAFRTN